jgi:preprotein translocase subunit SecB
MDKISSALVLQQLVFDKIAFNRKGFKNNNELEFEIEVRIGTCKNDYKVTLILKAEKKDEYDFLISLSGFFTIEQDDELKDEQSKNLIYKNAVAILMPYLRSEVTLLTSQPEMDCVVLPLFNINKMFDKGNRKE